MASGINELIDQLYAMISDAFGLPLGTEKCVLNRSSALTLLDEIKAQLPAEIAEAKRLINGKNEFVQAARDEADKLRQDAADEARRLVEKENVVIAARQKAGEIIGEAEAKAATVVTYPGSSEHQSGLCVDMHNFRAAGRDMADDFANSDAGKWLQENCYKFGYVLRFEKDKTDITGITYESWHFRYVGRFHATRMHELDMCLEEYCAYLAGYGYEINGHLS